MLVMPVWLALLQKSACATLFTSPRLAWGSRCHRGQVRSAGGWCVFRHWRSHRLDGQSRCCNIFLGPNLGVVWFCGWDRKTLNLHELQTMDAFMVLTSDLPCWSVTGSHQWFQELQYAAVRTATLERHTVLLSKSWSNFCHHCKSLSSNHTWNELVWTLLQNVFILCYCPWLLWPPSVKEVTVLGLHILSYFAFSIC